MGGLKIYVPMLFRTEQDYLKQSHQNVVEGQYYLLRWRYRELKKYCW